MCVVLASDVSSWNHKPRGMGLWGAISWQPEPGVIIPDSCLTGENTNYWTISDTDTHSRHSADTVACICLMCVDICQVSNISPS